MPMREARDMRVHALAERARELVGEQGAERAALELGAALAAECRAVQGAAALADAVLHAGAGATAAALAWARQAAGDRRLVLAPLLQGLGDSPARAAAARARVQAGPLYDALACVALTGSPAWLSGESQEPALAARLELLLWEGGTLALGVPELGRWLWREPLALDALVLTRVRGRLRERALAARTLALAADGIPEDGAPELITRTLSAARALARHPENAVWIPAARALGRLSARVPAARALLDQWATGPRRAERRRATTALACVPGDDGGWLEQKLAAVGAGDDASSDDPWLAAALGPALPYVLRERRELWCRLRDRLAASAPGPELLWSVTQALSPLLRRPDRDPDDEAFFASLRARAQSHEPRAATDAELWELLRHDTDFLDDVAPDPSFPDVWFERLVGDALRLGEKAVVARAQGPVRALVVTFEGALRGALEERDRGRLGRHLASLQSCSRAWALALWEPIATAAGSADIGRGVHQDTDRLLSAGIAELLGRTGLDYAVQRAGLRALGHLIDHTSHTSPTSHAWQSQTPAQPPSHTSAPGAGTGSERSRVTAFAARTLGESPLAALEGRELGRFRKPLSDLLRRIGDAVGDEGERSSEEHPLPPRLLAWWALTRPGIGLIRALEQREAGEHPTGSRVLEGLGAITSAQPLASLGTPLAQWSKSLADALTLLEADDTPLASAVRSLIGAIAASSTIVADERDEEHGLALLAYAVGRFAPLADDPLAAIAHGSSAPRPAPIPERTLLDRLTAALAADEPEPAAHSWASAAGPVLSPEVARAVLRLVDARAHRQRTRPLDRGTIGPYTLHKHLGGGGMGDVWLASKGGSRKYVVKIPKLGRTIEEDELEGLKRTLEREARLLEGLHDGKLATYQDYGWDQGTPYLVMSYLIGADLERYANVYRFEVDELKPVVRDIALGLRALHERQIVHRDLKPANVFLRLALPLDADESFGDLHRDPAVAPIVEAVLVDFGIAHLVDGQPQALCGTPGFMSPEQATFGAIDTRSDVYSFAATVFWAVTGHAFFLENRSDADAWVNAHAEEDPFDNQRVKEAARKLPRALQKLLRDATQREPADRPSAWEFHRRFDAL